MKKLLLSCLFLSASVIFATSPMGEVNKFIKKSIEEAIDAAPASVSDVLKSSDGQDLGQGIMYVGGCSLLVGMFMTAISHDAKFSAGFATLACTAAYTGPCVGTYLGQSSTEDKKAAATEDGSGIVDSIQDEAITIQVITQEPAQPEVIDLAIEFAQENKDDTQA